MVNVVSIPKYLLIEDSGCLVTVYNRTQDCIASVRSSVSRALVAMSVYQVKTCPASGFCRIPRDADAEHWIFPLDVLFGFELVP